MQKIIVENFGPIKHAEIELRDFVVLIGEQASGKSTIAKVVYFFQWLSRDFFWKRESNQQLHDKTLLSQFSEIVRNNFYRFYGTTKNYRNFKLTYEFNSEDSHVVFVSPGDNGVPNISWSIEAEKYLEVLSKQAVKAANSSIIATAYPNDYPSQEVMDNVSIWMNLVRNFLHDKSDHTIYFPAERVIETSYPGYFSAALKNYYDKGSDVYNQANLVIMKDYLEHVELLKSAFAPHGGFVEMIANMKVTSPNKDLSHLEFVIDKSKMILKSNYKNKNGAESLMISDDQSIPLYAASTGQQETLRIIQDILIVLLGRVPSYRIIEEPEAHLFPTSQKHLIELLALMINYTDSQAFITTHSPYVLSILANLLYASKIKKLGAATAKEVEEKTGMSELTWLDKEKFAAYTMEDGSAKSIFDKEDSGMINQNYLDEVSEDLGREFQVLHNLRLKQIRENTSK